MSRHTRRRCNGGRGRQYARGARGGRCRAPRSDQRRAHARRCDDRRSALNLDRRRSRALGRPVIQPFTVIRGHRASRREPGRASCRAPRRDRRRRRLGSRSVTFAPARFSRPVPRPARSWRSRTPLIGEQTKVPHLSYIGDADIGANTNIAAGNITVNQDHAAREGADRDRTASGPGSTMRSSPQSRSATTHGLQPAPSSQRMSPGRFAIARAEQVNKEGRGGKRND